MNKSVQTINSPEFINLQALDINPLMSSCEIKVLYVGANRNGSFISKEVATEMAKTLRGAPIVGYWRKDVEDFGDHGQQVVINMDGVEFQCLTVPYGFVAPNAKVWFQTFIDTNEFGEETEREYLMTTGYLWTGQFPECKSAVEGEGKPHSMELDPESVDGHWATDRKGMDFFIINDATFSKLCILGSDVEPCFEGSSVAAPNVSASFAKLDDNFKQTLFSMMQDLKFALEGGQQMEENQVVEPVTPVVEEPVTPPVEEPASEPAADPAPATEPVAASEPEGEPAADPAPAADPEPDFAKKDDEENDDKKDDEGKPGEEGEPAKDDDEDDDEKKKYQLLETQHAELQASYTALEAQYNELNDKFTALTAANKELVEFKAKIDDEAKDAMIAKFFMLSDEDEDKKEVIANKANYSLEEIEEKLSVICFRKKVNFDLENNSKNDNNTEAPVVTFNIGGATGASQPAWLSAVDNFKNKI